MIHLMIEIVVVWLVAILMGMPLFASMDWRRWPSSPSAVSRPRSCRRRWRRR
jgi:hypothetical protein